MGLHLYTGALQLIRQHVVRTRTLFLVPRLRFMCLPFNATIPPTVVCSLLLPWTIIGGGTFHGTDLPGSALSALERRASRQRYQK